MSKPRNFTGFTHCHFATKKGRHFGDFAAEKDFQNRNSTFFVILFSKLPFIEKEKEVE